MPKKLETKRIEAQERQNFYDSLSVREKIRNLDKLFGPGLGAKKERAKLAKQLSKEL